MTGRRRPKAIIFDWDNTLVDTWPVIHETLNATFSRYGLEPWTFEQTATRVRKSLRDSFPSLFGEQWEEAGQFFYDYFAKIHLERLEPLPGAASMLRDLKQGGIYLGVVSNKRGEYLRLEVAHLGWDGHFSRLVGALDASNDKPATDPVHLALAGSGLEPGPEVWFAGDADIDLECAQNAGCVPVLVRKEAPEPGEFEAHPPVWHFRECVALCKQVQSM